jgi:hypothetical protein
MLTSFLFQPRIKRVFIPLDPLTVMFKLAMLPTYPIGTKLGIHPCMIHFYEPGVAQGSVRWFYGDQRDDITHLYGPILWYLKHYYNIDDEKHRNLTTLAIRGLSTLKQIYRQTNELHESLLIHTIQHYIDILQDPSHYEDRIREEHDNRALYDVIIQKVRNLWTEDEVTFLFDHFNMIQRQIDRDGAWKMYRRSFLDILNEKEQGLSTWWNYQSMWTARIPRSDNPTTEPTPYNNPNPDPDLSI